MRKHTVINRIRPAIRACAGVCLALSFHAGLSAADKAPLPAQLVKTSTGAIVPLAQLGPDGKWLLLYVTSASPASMRLVQALKRWEVDTSRIVVLIGDNENAAAALVTREQVSLPNVRWAVDPDSAAWRALAVRGVPALIGVQGGKIDWKLVGVLNNPQSLDAVVKSWLAP